MSPQTIAIIGGTGFVGQHLAHRLAAEGHTLRILSRRAERHRALTVLPTVQVVEADAHDPQPLRARLAGCDAVISLAGILNERRRGDFAHVHVELPRKIVTACRELGIRRLLHMSVLHASASAGPSRYLRTKGEGEDLVRAAHGPDLAVTTFAPSVIFGPGDSFFNRFGSLLKRAPILPLACPHSRFAPVYVGDVVHAYATALASKQTHGQRYTLCGPRTYTLRELVAYTATTLHLCRPIIGLPNGVARAQGVIMGLLPGKPFTTDNYLSLQVDSVCEGPFPAVFSISPAAVEAVVPYYLGRRGQRGLYDVYRKEARA